MVLICIYVDYMFLNDTSKGLTLMRGLSSSPKLRNNNKSILKSLPQVYSMCHSAWKNVLSVLLTDRNIAANSLLFLVMRWDWQVQYMLKNIFFPSLLRMCICGVYAIIVEIRDISHEPLGTGLVLEQITIASPVQLMGYVSDLCNYNYDSIHCIFAHAH